MFNFLLGVATEQPSSQATEQKFTELENGIYERMQDVQDMTHTIQSDQITFLNDQLTNFYTIISIAVAILTVLGGWAIASIKNANNKAKEHMTKAEEHMELATTMMENAKTLSQEANENIKLLQEEQTNLRKLLDSKDLDEKLITLERTAEITSRLEMQVNATSNLQRAKTFLEKALETYTNKDFKEYWDKDTAASEQRKDGLAAINRVSFLTTQMLQEINLFGSNPQFFNKKQVHAEIENVLAEANEIYKDATNFYYEYIMPQQERIWEKGD